MTTDSVIVRPFMGSSFEGGAAGFATGAIAPPTADVLSSFSAFFSSVKSTRSDGLFAVFDNAPGIPVGALAAGLVVAPKAGALVFEAAELATVLAALELLAVFAAVLAESPL